MSASHPNLALLEKRIGYCFRNPDLLLQALTHPSFANDEKRGCQDNQRLEFLGDAILQATFTHLIFHRFPQLREGDLTKIRAASVSRPALKQLASELELGKYLRLGRGENCNQGRTRASNLADAMEAVIGAIYLDSDYPQTLEWITRTFEKFIDSPPTTQNIDNPKGALQELIQGTGRPTPIYELVDESGPDHHKTYLFRVLCHDEELGRGKGNSKKAAEIAAASDALQRLRQSS